MGTVLPTLPCCPAARNQPSGTRSSGTEPSALEAWGGKWGAPNSAVKVDAHISYRSPVSVKSYPLRFVRPAAVNNDGPGRKRAGATDAKRGSRVAAAAAAQLHRGDGRRRPMRRRWRRDGCGGGGSGAAAGRRACSGVQPSGTRRTKWAATLSRVAKAPKRVTPITRSPTRSADPAGAASPPPTRSTTVFLARDPRVKPTMLPWSSKSQWIMREHRMKCCSPLLIDATSNLRCSGLLHGRGDAD